jgi:endonuclease/exonuclease/phosphatase family metal-dependent hydrolase
MDGCVAVARWALDPTWFASVHAQASPVRPEILDLHSWEEVPLCNPGRNVWQMDLIPFELHRLFASQTFVWGGDLNSAMSMDEVPGFSGGNRRLREIWTEAGSHDLRMRFFTEEQQTFFAPNRGAYQLDHVFADAATQARVVDWRVDAEPVLSHPSLSDHAPIWVELQ